MTKYVLNGCYGGFGLSDEAFKWLIDNKGWTTTKEEDEEDNTAQIWIVADSDFTNMSRYHANCPSDYSLEFRSNPDLVECVESLGKKANGFCAELYIVECPHGPNDGIEIDEYDVQESLQSIPERW